MVEWIPPNGRFFAGLRLYHFGCNISVMDGTQNFAQEVNMIDTAVRVAEKEGVVTDTTDLRHESFIDWTALGGTVIMFDEETNTEKIRKMPLYEIAAILKVDTRTLMNWRESIPDFWSRVQARRKELGGQQRLTMLEDKWFLKAMEMKNWPITEAWLRHYKPDYKESKQKVEHEVGNSMAELLRQLDADKKGAQHVIEAQVTTSEAQQPNL